MIQHAFGLVDNLFTTFSNFQTEINILKPINFNVIIIRISSASNVNRNGVDLIVDEPEADIASLAVRCGVTPEHARRACKRLFGQGPVALRRDGRIRRAISLLRFGATPTEAAFEAGFSDQPHLTRLLKRETGLTPATFRQD